MPCEFPTAIIRLGVPQVYLLGYPFAVFPLKKKHDLELVLGPGELAHSLTYFYIQLTFMRVAKISAIFQNGMLFYEVDTLAFWKLCVCVCVFVPLHVYAYVPMYLHVYLCVLMCIHLGGGKKRRGSRQRWVLRFDAHVYGFQMLISEDISTISKQNSTMSSGLRLVALINFDFN